MSLKNSLNKKIDAFLEQYKANKPILLEFGNDSESLKYFEKVSDQLNFDSSIEVIPPNRLRNSILGFKIKTNSTRLFFFCYLVKPRGCMQFQIQIDCRITSKMYNRSVYLGERSINYPFETIEKLLLELLEFLKVFELEESKKEKINSIKTNVLQQQIKSKIVDLNLKCDTIKEKNKLILKVELLRKRSLYYPFYFKSFDKDIKKMDAILKEIVKLKATIEEYPKYITIK